MSYQVPSIDRVHESRYSPTHCQVFLRLADADNLRRHLDPILLYTDASPSKPTRDASAAAETALDDFLVDASARLDVFTAKKAAHANIAKGVVQLGREEQRLVERMIRDGVRNGLDLGERERGELVVLKKELAQACVEFRVRARVMSTFIRRDLLICRLTCFAEKRKRGECM